MGSCFASDHPDNGKIKRYLLDTSERMLIYGYIRKNFDVKCLIDEIIKKVMEFYFDIGGSLYVFGNGVGGRLGLKKYDNRKRPYCKVPTLCPAFADNNAYKACAAWNHLLVLDTDGNVWSCGYGKDGQLGIHIEDIDEDYLLIPTKLNLDKRVVSVCAGLSHSLLLCDNGWMQSFGMNNFGQIGHADLEKSFVPKTIERLKKYNVVQICTGLDYSAALTEDGDLFCFGQNRNGQCGVGKLKEKKIMIPTKVEMDEQISFVGCGDNHTLIISDRGLIYSFGADQCGQLGHGPGLIQQRWTPTLIESLGKLKKRIAMCAAGENHSLCINEDGIIWSFGSNHFGQCGLVWGIFKQYVPKMIEWFIANDIKTKECFAGSEQSSVIAEDGGLYVFGRNEYFQLGLEEQKNYFTPTKLSLTQSISVLSVSMGSTHSAIICARR